MYDASPGSIMQPSAFARRSSHATSSCSSACANSAKQACFSLRDLAVNGGDLLALGLRGPAVGEALNALLEQVLDGTLPNEREALLDAVRRLP